MENINELLKETKKLHRENKRLQQQLHEARESIEAVKRGNIDALIIADKKDLKVYTEKTADKPYRVLIEKMHEGAVTLNETGTILYCNSCFANMVNLPLHEVTGTTFRSFIDASSKKCFNRIFKYGWKKDIKEEVCIFTSDAKVVPALMSVNALPLENNFVLSIILTDLTLLKKNEEELKHKTRQLQQKHLELESAYQELVLQNDEKEKRAAELSIANKELAFQSEEKEKRAAELRDQNKQLLAAREKIVKLNERLESRVKERTRELELSRQHFKFLTDHIPQMAWTANSSGTINYYNAKWRKYTGMSLAEAKQTGWKSIIYPDDLPKAEIQWKRSVETGKVYEEEFRIKCIIDDEYRWHLCRALPFKDETGKIVKWFGTCTEIEEQKKAMEQKDEFIGIASHELRTPITSLKAYIQLLERELKDKNNPEAIQYVLKSHKLVEKLNLLITELHDITKIQAGKFQLIKTEFNFDEFLDDTIKSIQITNSTHNITKNGEANITIVADKHRLQQVLFNYLTNAIKYSPGANKVIVEVNADKKLLTVAVKDFGLGIPKKEISKIFTRFFRASSTRNIEGLGLGLYLCKQIIKAHQGEVWVESKEGKGSKFFFSLPVESRKRLITKGKLRKRPDSSLLL